MIAPHGILAGKRYLIVSLNECSKENSEGDSSITSYAVPSCVREVSMNSECHSKADLFFNCFNRCSLPGCRDPLCILPTLSIAGVYLYSSQLYQRVSLNTATEGESGSEFVRHRRGRGGILHAILHAWDAGWWLSA